jgi:hypothetical protein
LFGRKVPCPLRYVTRHFAAVTQAMRTMHLSMALGIVAVVLMNLATATQVRSSDERAASSNGIYCVACIHAAQ